MGAKSVNTLRLGLLICAELAHHFAAACMRRPPLPSVLLQMPAAGTENETIKLRPASRVSETAPASFRELFPLA